MKLPERTDQPTFWLYAVPLVLAHLALGFILTKGSNGGLGGIDTVVIIALAAVVGGRFKDIGWPGWIGPTFMLGTMLVIPILVAAYAITNRLPPDQFMALMNPVGLVVGVANFVLLVVAGTMPGKEPAAAATAPAVESVQAAVEPDPSLTAPVAAAEPRKADPMVIGAIAVFALAVVGLVVVLVLFPQQHASQALSSPPAPPASVSAPSTAVRPNQVQGYGLTKDTADFLRQMSQQPRGANQ
jgi:hypothetical protein